MINTNLTCEESLQPGMGTQEILIVFVIVYFSGWVMGTWVLMLFFSMIKDCLKKEKGETNKWNL